MADMKSIIELASEAGITELISLSDSRLSVLERFAHLVRQQVLEEAAGVCEETSSGWAQTCAVAIRALKEKT